jgi:hypothetical protein
MTCGTWRAIHDARRRRRHDVDGDRRIDRGAGRPDHGAGIPTWAYWCGRTGAPKNYVKALCRHDEDGDRRVGPALVVHRQIDRGAGRPDHGAGRLTWTYWCGRTGARKGHATVPCRHDVDGDHRIDRDAGHPDRDAGWRTWANWCGRTGARTRREAWRIRRARVARRQIDRAAGRPDHDAGRLTWVPWSGRRVALRCHEALANRRGAVDARRGARFREKTWRQRPLSADGAHDRQKHDADEELGKAPRHSSRRNFAGPGLLHRGPSTRCPTDNLPSGKQLPRAPHGS